MTNRGCLGFLIPGLRVIPQNQVMVIERLGKFSRMAESGVHILRPFVEKPRPFTMRVTYQRPDGKKQVVTQRSEIIDLREQVLDFPKQSVITADNVVMEIDAVLYFQIADPVKAIYKVANFSDAIEKLTQTTLRNVIGELTLDATLSSRDDINGRLLTILDEATDNWGVNVTRVELQDIIPPPEIRKAMELQMTAERRKRAQLLQAEGDKQTNILTAEGDANAQIQKNRAIQESRRLEAETDAYTREVEAKGAAKARQFEAQAAAQARQMEAAAEAQALAAIAKVVGNEQAVEYMVGMRYLETLQGMADGRGNTTFMPFEAAGALGAVGSLKEVLKKDDLSDLLKK